MWFSPELRVTYRPRSRVRDLARQMFETGRWRREVVRRHPDTASVRYLAPPLTVAAIGAGTALGSARPRVRRAVAPGRLPRPCSATLTVVLSATAAAGSRLDPAARAWLPLVLGVTHLSWGAGFLVGLPARNAD